MFCWSCALIEFAGYFLMIIISIALEKSSIPIHCVFSIGSGSVFTVLFLSIVHLCGRSIDCILPLKYWNCFHLYQGKSLVCDGFWVERPVGLCCVSSLPTLVVPVVNKWQPRNQCGNLTWTLIANLMLSWRVYDGPIVSSWKIGLHNAAMWY